MVPRLSVKAEWAGKSPFSGGKSKVYARRSLSGGLAVGRKDPRWSQHEERGGGGQWEGSMPAPGPHKLVCMTVSNTDRY